MLANACGPCIGQWDRPASITGQPNTIVNSYNRNFPKRNDGSANTLSFVTSPDTVIALALSGRLDFDPTTETLTAPDGTEVKLDPPVGEVLPDQGYDPGQNTFTPPPADGSGVVVEVSPTSDRLQLLQPFPAWDGNDYLGLPVLMKAKGKCTTDHISAAGKWLTYRGHLENISGNLFLGAVNAFTDAVGEGKDVRDGSIDTYPEPGQEVRQAGVRWCAIGDRNYGEGSSREHAAMEPRFRGGVVIFARSFARIHETNLKKQGLVPLTFADGATYDLIDEDDRINVLGLPPEPGQNVRCQIVKPDGTHRRLRGRAHVQRRAGRVVPGRLGAERRAPQGGRRQQLTARPGRMDLIEALRTTGAARTFTDQADRRCHGCRHPGRRPVRAQRRQPAAVEGRGGQGRRACDAAWPN